MFRFNMIRSAKDIIGNFILVVLPVLLIWFFHYVYSDQLMEAGGEAALSQVTMTFTISFALMFQIFGSALSFETLGLDFLTPKRNRLLATPTEPKKMVLSVLTTSTMVSFAQTLVVILFSALILEAEFPSFPLVAVILFISVVFNQLFGTMILFLTQKVNTATAVTSFYGTVAPIISGMYFPLPDIKWLNFIGDYLTPLALANTAIEGAMTENFSKVVIGVIPLIVLIGIFIALLNPLSKKVIA